MHVEPGKHYLVIFSTGELAGELTFADGFEQWPASVNGWKHAMDCTIEPYTERTLEENLKFAIHMNKKAIVVPAEGHG